MKTKDTQLVYQLAKVDISAVGHAAKCLLAI